ncbi:MAG TPA: serine/threonine-protein kinase, partial [Pseudonocardia sp.]
MFDVWQVPGFTEIRELGRGSGGTVVQAADRAGTPVAIKYLSDDLLADDGFRAAFRVEAELLAELDTPHVTRLFEYVESARGAAIVMELVDGTSLRTTLTEHGPTDAESALSVLKGSLLGLAAAHRAGVVHRDYKPENVLITLDGESKLVDFGVAARTGGAGDGAGTPAYMPPEQWAGWPASARGDIYAATATFMEALTGHPPFVADDLVTLRDLHENAEVPVDGLPEPVRWLAQRGLAKVPAERPADAHDLLLHLEYAAVTAYGPDWEERGRDSLARRAALLALLAGGAVAGAAGGSGLATTVLAHAGRVPRRPPVAVAAAALVMVAGLATVSGSSASASLMSETSVGQTILPQRVAVQPRELPAAPPARSAPAGSINTPVPAGPPTGGASGLSSPAGGAPAGTAGGGGTSPRPIPAVPPPPAPEYHPGPPDVYRGPDRDDNRPRGGGDGHPRYPGGGDGRRPPHPWPGGGEGKRPPYPWPGGDGGGSTGDGGGKYPRHP